MMKPKARSLVVAVAILAVTAPLTTLAQEEPQLWTVATVQVHQNMIGEFEALQKELSAAYKKVGAVRLIGQVARGPSAEYSIWSPMEKWADLDNDTTMAKALGGEAAAANWVARVTKCVKDRRVDTLRSRPDLSVPTREGRNATLAVMTTRRNLSGRMGDYENYLLNQWLPAVKAAGMDGYSVFRNAFGGSNREWVTLSFVDDWATFDSPHPVRAHLGDEKYGELARAGGTLTTAATRKVMRLRPDLSANPDSSS